MNEKHLQVVSTALTKFYKKRIDKLSDKDIFAIIKRKNPYLYRAFGTNRGHFFVEELLSDSQTSSDETLFGEFFEEVAIGVSINGRKSSSDSVDLEIWSEDEKSVKLYAVKSGTSVFNAMSLRRQNDSFKESIKRLKGIAVIPLVGYSYGRKESRESSKNNFEEKAGQCFWEDITGDSNFYIDLINLIGTVADVHKIEFESEWNKCINRLSHNFLSIFGNNDGSINWDNIVQFNSGKEIPKEITQKIKEFKKSSKK